MAITYFSSLWNIEFLIFIVLTAPPFTGFMSESIKSPATISVLNSSLSKLPVVRLPAVDEYLTMYFAAASLESRSLPGAVNCSWRMSGRLVAPRSVTWPGGVLSSLMSTSLVTWKAPPAACLGHGLVPALSPRLPPGEVSCGSFLGSWRHGIAATAEWSGGIWVLREHPAASEATIDVGVIVTRHLALHTVPPLPGVLGKPPGAVEVSCKYFTWHKFRHS